MVGAWPKFNKGMPGDFRNCYEKESETARIGLGAVSASAGPWASCSTHILRGRSNHQTDARILVSVELCSLG